MFPLIFLTSSFRIRGIRFEFEESKNFFLGLPPHGDVVSAEFVRDLPPGVAGDPRAVRRGQGRRWFVGGVVLVEQVFNWPGLGSLAVQAIETVDVPVILGTVIFTSLLVVFSGILIDLVQGVVDPRIRETRRGT